jgi:acyl-CoA thioesterase I
MFLQTSMIMRKTLFISLFCLLAVVEIAMFAQTPIKVACVGNSITEGSGTVTYPQQLAALLKSGWNVQNYGVSGRTLLKHGDYPYWKEQKFKNALAFQPDIVIIMLGTNDSKPYNWIYKNEFYKDYLALVDTFANLDSKPEIWVCHPLKAFSGGYDINDSVILHGVIPKVDSVIANRTVKTIDFYTLTLDKKSMYNADGIHPLTEGNLFLAKVIFETLVDSAITVVNDSNVLLKRPVSTGEAGNSTNTLLTDGDLGSEWVFSSLPAWAVIDLGTTQKIDNFQVLLSSDINKGYQYKIEGSSDGSNWATLVNKSTRQDTLAYYSLDSISTITAKYVRLTITSFSNSSSQQGKISEFKAIMSNGMKHAPLIYTTRSTEPRVRFNAVPLFLGDEMAVYKNVTNSLTSFLMINAYIANTAVKYLDRVGKLGEVLSEYSVTFYNGNQINSDISRYTFTEQNDPVGVESKKGSSVKVYPNPFTSEVKISNLSVSSLKSEIKIYDVNGRLIRMFKSNGRNDAGITWNRTDMSGKIVPSGVYFCCIESGTEMIRFKIIAR